MRGKEKNNKEKEVRRVACQVGEKRGEDKMNDK